ncbi:hypothetical protein BJ138DRAFT_995855 [Hygrophoropsis aurantiaca]|uniref:Uncharacterized protein n=1 Tax=Hygrophoropsis aurantiaca TaxID=72124 RepID=A0ACB8ASU5_9AGAM|nr:hypothetical protein BJ138DRAFT_995855 [Hygrophoropsis aurantiaca]
MTSTLKTASFEFDVALPRAATEPFRSNPIPPKRIIVCCDGTWQDGVVVDERWKYTNVLKLSRALNHVDDRRETPVAQIVFYQSGIGSAHNIYSEYHLQLCIGATGASLVEKVQEAYAFISQNYHPGDEIFLFGFSRGAYTARMVAMFIGAIGVLDRMDMDHFADIFHMYQKLGKLDPKDPKDQPGLQHSKLAPWTSHESRGKKRADSDDDTFSIKCVGVFDTVGSVGLPEEITHKSPSTKSIFGFPNTELGEHIERAYQALAINEIRKDFDCAKFQQSPGGFRKNQILKQCWFAGSHSDIGGGWKDHDLADYTLVWMVAHIGDMLSVDLSYIAGLPKPVAPWGQQPPHNPKTGIFMLAECCLRTLPTKTDDITHETIHPSAMEQKNIVPQLKANVKANPSLVCQLLPLEEELRKNWSHIPGQAPSPMSQGAVQVQTATAGKTTFLWSTTKEAVSIGSSLGSQVIRKVQTRVPISTTDWLHSLAHESNVGAVLKEYASYNGKL